MKVQVLVSTMHQENYEILNRMNIQTDAIIINQCDSNSFSKFNHYGNQIQWYSFAERGIGLSRNSALSRASADILLFSDDDVVYVDGYEKIITEFFENHPNVGLTVFNLQSLNPKRPEKINEIEHRLLWYNCLKYGACRIAVRRECIQHANIHYSLLFGGGAKHQAGEDNLFINDCIKSGIICMASTGLLGTVKQEESTWFNGYDEKYYKDKGALFAAMYGRKAHIMVLIFEMRKRNASIPFLKRLKLENDGIKDYLAMIK